MNKSMILYHTGFDVIKEPDIRHGRKNADFGQGFYMTADEEFARRWARVRKEGQTVVNRYELNTTGLDICRFERSREWFEYIMGNRHQKDDEIASDVIIGPIANDTIYDTFGIITSGMLQSEMALKLLLAGPEYYQITVKTEKAVQQLRWTGSYTLGADEVSAYRQIVAEEEAEYQQLISKEMENM